MENTRTKHPALSLLMSLSVAGTCLAVPGLAFAAPSAEPDGSPSANAEEVVAAAAPDAAQVDEAAADAKDAATADATTDATAAGAGSVAGDAGTSQKGAERHDAPGKGAKDGKGARVDTKDIKVDGATVTFAGVSVDVPSSFKVMGLPGVMAVAVSPSGEMSVTVAAPDALSLATLGNGTADQAYFDSLAAALAEGAGIDVPAAQEVQLADGTTGYEYVFQLTDTDDGKTELDDTVYLVFVPVDDAYVTVQITTDEDVASVTVDTVDQIISSIRLDAADGGAQAKPDAGVDATKTKEAVDDAQMVEVAEPAASDPAADSNPVIADAEKAAADADAADQKAREELAEKGAADKKVDADSKAGNAAVADEKNDAAEKADAADAPATDATDAVGTAADVAGMSFVVPEGLTPTDTSTDEHPVWSDADGALTVTVNTAVSTDASNLTVRDLDRTAIQLARSMNGEVVGYAVYENDAATVYLYAIVFPDADGTYVGAVGFVPVADGTLNALTSKFFIDAMDQYQPVIEQMYQSVTVD